MSLVENSDIYVSEKTRSIDTIIMCEVDHCVVDTIFQIFALFECQIRHVELNYI